MEHCLEDKWQFSDGKLGKGIIRLRFCDKCEQQNCVNDWENFSELEKEQLGRDYYTLENVTKRRKAKNKGRMWMGRCLIKAKNQLRQEHGYTQRKLLRNGILFARARQLQAAFVDALAQDDYSLLDAFGVA